MFYHHHRWITTICCLSFFFLSLSVLLSLKTTAAVEAKTNNNIRSNNNNNNDEVEEENKESSYFYPYPHTTLGSSSSSSNSNEVDNPNNNNNDKKIILLPLCGMGVGNLQHDLIREEISIALSSSSSSSLSSSTNDDQQQQNNNNMNSNMNYRLIDTAHASRNEHLIADGIRKANNNMVATMTTTHDDNDNDSNDDEIHIITKIWYTYLGYERTVISVKESLLAFKNLSSQDTNNVIINIHMLLHWPRCNDDIPWMNCLEEENALPQHVKDSGDPPPHLNKQTAFKESWKALEDIYLGKTNVMKDFDDDNESNQSFTNIKIASIGVSNFYIDDLKELIKDARITPHILQGNVWSYVFDPYLIKFCQEHNIHFQAYNVMNGIHNNRQKDSPRAYSLLSSIATELMSSESSSGGTIITPAQIIIKWLIQNNVSTIPRTTNLQHLKENSPSSIGSIPNLNTKQLSKVELAVRALLKGIDLNPPEVTFVNKKDNNILHLYWKNHNGELIPVKNNMNPGDNFKTSTHPGHVFVAIHKNKNNQDDVEEETRTEYIVGADYGEKQQIHILDDEL